MQSFFITSSGTEIGKTLVTTSLCYQLMQMGKRVTALKPVISGFDERDPESDSALILRSCGLSHDPQVMRTISPWQYAAPLAPSMAAAREGKILDMQALVDFCKEHTTLKTDLLLVEGVGGVMAPLTPHQSVLDWMVQLQWPVILVTGSYLGSISHTLTAIEVLRTKGLTLQALVVCESEKTGVTLSETIEELSHFVSSQVPIVKIPRIRVHAEKWKHAPMISWIVESGKL
jgi:dethiobiotin synthetase